MRFARETGDLPLLSEIAREAEVLLPLSQRDWVISHSVLGALFDSSSFGQECGWAELRVNALLELQKDACSKEPLGELAVCEKHQQ